MKLMGRDFKSTTVKVLSVVFFLCVIFSSFQFISHDSREFSIDNYMQFGTRQNDTVNYTQLCLDFIQENYPDKTIERYNSYIEGPDRETEFTYTVITAHLYPGETPSGDPVQVSIRHDTLNIEFGTEQINTDWEVYYIALPIYYKKINNIGRQNIIFKIGYLPMIDNPIAMNYSADVTFFCSPMNQSKIIMKFQEMELDYYFEYEGEIEINDTIIANITLGDILALSNENYVEGTYFLSIWPYEKPLDDYNSLKLFVEIIIVVSVLIVGISYYQYKFKKSKGE